MRPRYRVWDKEEKKMIYDAENTYDSYPVDISSFGMILDLPNLYDVMQYTGIKDIHNIKIYEGDIVKVIPAYGHGTRIGKVIYYENKACFLIETTETDYFTFMSQDLKSVEILGNIYQNKELLDE